MPSVTGLDFEPVDEIDHVVEPATGAGADAASGDGNGQMGLSGAGPADQHGVALLGDKSAAGEVTHECLVDGRALELEVVEVLGERQLGDRELVLDRARLLLVDLGIEQITDNALGFVLTFADTPADGKGFRVVAIKSGRTIADQVSEHLDIFRRQLRMLRMVR